MHHSLCTPSFVLAALLTASCSSQGDAGELGDATTSDDESTAAAPSSSGPGVTTTGDGGSSSPTGGEGSSSTSGTVGCDATGFYVQGSTLFDVNCQRFVFRGINYPYVWYASRDDTAEQLLAIRETGANTVRLVLANGEQWDRVGGDALAQLLQWARDAQLVAIVEVHDATGWSEQTAAADPSTAVAYWLSDDVREALRGHEDTVVINIANEPFGNTTTEQWAPFHVDALAQLRRGGLRHTLLVDAPNWGQDWTHTMRDGAAAQQVFEADPLANTMFAVHMYEVYGDAGAVQTYVSTFLESGLALVVGEFALSHNNEPVAAQAILTTAQSEEIGYLGWSWSGNSPRLSALDVVSDFDPDVRTAWGQLLVEGRGGLAETGEPCSCLQ